MEIEITNLQSGLVQTLSGSTSSPGEPFQLRERLEVKCGVDRYKYSRNCSPFPNTTVFLHHLLDSSGRKFTPKSRKTSK